MSRLPASEQLLLATLFVVWALVFGLATHDTREEIVPALTGCELLIRRQVLEEIGLFNTDYFVYVEDIDLSTRAARAGYSSVYVPDSVMVHHAGSSTGGGYGACPKYMVAYNIVISSRSMAPGRSGWPSWPSRSRLGPSYSSSVSSASGGVR